MSRESIDWLNTFTLIGMTEKYGNAWSWRAGTDNHFPGFVPVTTVIERLFDWEPIVTVRACPCGCGNVDKDISRSDNRHRLGIFKDGYQPHPYKETLVQTTTQILGGGIGIGSAGVLKLGAVAWVQCELEESVRTAEGVEFRPHLTATTSLDGSVATTWMRNYTRVVCDNTLAAARSERGESFKVKHTRNSVARIADARQALGLLETIVDDVSAEIHAQCAVSVSGRQWSAFLDAYAPVPTDGEAPKRTITMAETKRATLQRLYTTDLRCAPWAGTQYGVLQTVDTFTRHEANVRNVIRAERAMLNLVTGKAEKEADAVAELLNRVLATV